MSMESIQKAPSPEILAAFGLPAVPARLLADGRGRSWSVTSAILRPVDDPLEAQWIAELYAQLPAQGFRIPRPLAAASGSYVHEGWSAWQYVPGRHENDGDWSSLLDTCQRFHAAIAHLDPPGFLATERHHWAMADRIAWAEERINERWNLADAIQRLQSVCDQADRQLPRQLIHGDIAGNLLYEAGRAPAVIDFSPYWRPMAWALAIAVADAIAWHGAPEAVLQLSREAGVTDSLLYRAIIFRLAAVSASPDQGDADQQAELNAYSRVLAILERPHPLQ